MIELEERGSRQFLKRQLSISLVPINAQNKDAKSIRGSVDKNNSNNGCNLYFLQKQVIRPQLTTANRPTTL
jgi:hypothetical protein